MKRVISIILLAVGLFVISTTGSGCKNRNEKIQVEDSISTDSDSLAVDTSNHPLALLAKGLAGVDYDGVGNFYKGVAPIWKGDKLGVINKEGKLIAPIIYNYANNNVDDQNRACMVYESEGLIRLTKGEKYEFVDLNGEVITALTTDFSGSIGNCNNGLFSCSKDGKTGYLNKSGKEIIPFIYNQAGDFKDGIALVKKENEWMYINTSGKVVTSIGNVYMSISRLDDGVTCADDSTRNYRLIDRNGNILCTYSYIEAARCSEGLVPVSNGEKEGYVNMKGKEVIPCIYGMVFEFHDGLARVYNDRDGSLSYYIDKSGKIVIDLTNGTKYEDYEDFHEGIAIVEKNGIYGGINKKGNEVIGVKYEKIGSFSEGLANAQKDGKWGYLNKSGEEVIPFIYDTAGSFCDGLALVKKDNHYGFVDKSGNSTFEYEDGETKKKIEQKIKKAEEEKKNDFKQYSDYVGTWKLNRTESGQKMRIEVTLKENHSGEFVVFLLKGSHDEVLVFENYPKCILTDGVIYLTKNGDITRGDVPKLKAASDGLYSFDNEKYVRDSK